MGSPVDEKFIIAAEEKLDCRFPEDFRAFLQNHNGCCLLCEDEDSVLNGLTVFSVLDTSDKKKIRKSSRDEITRENASIKEYIDGYIYAQEAIHAYIPTPDEIVFFATAEPRQFFFFLRKEEDPHYLEPNVFACGEYVTEPIKGQIVVLADSFSDFLQIYGLHPE